MDDLFSNIPRLVATDPPPDTTSVDLRMVLI